MLALMRLLPWCRNDEVVGGFGAGGLERQVLEVKVARNAYGNRPSVHQPLPFGTFPSQGFRRRA